MTTQTFQPKLLGLLCNWCAYAGADLAGVSRIQYPPNIRIIRLPCTGRVEPTFILKALASGVDGVLIAGCHPGDCHYLEGNYNAHRRFLLLKEVLGQLGVERERVRLEWVSASEGERFARIVNEMTQQIQKLGPIQDHLGRG